MAKKKKKKNKKNKETKEKIKKALGFLLPDEAKKWIWSIGLFLLTIIVTLSFFDLAGMGGRFLAKSLNFTLGEAAIAVPFFLFLLAALIFLSKEYKEVIWPSVFGIVLLTIGIAGTLECFTPGAKRGGWLGFLSVWPLQKIFGFLVTQIIFWAAILAGAVIFWKLLSRVLKEAGVIIEIEEKEDEEKESFIKKFFEDKEPDFNISTLGSDDSQKSKSKAKAKKKEKEESKEKKDSTSTSKSSSNKKTPPLDLLHEDQGQPDVGNTKKKSKIIKNTLKDFNIPVQMAGVNIGPTVTQYTFKPAEGIKLSKITSLSDDLALALAAHPVRIEAPIPGKSLVGVEIPNDEKAIVGLRGLLSRSEFQNSDSHLKIALGRNVSGDVSYADLGKMPHLLVAGSTGSGKTIFLYSLITSLLYQNTPDSLRLILIDPKRVEFSLLNNIPYLLAEVINDPDKAVNSLEWLVTEMERRFDLLSENKARDIRSYNKKSDDQLPYIVIVIDELADLMANKGKEVEKAIVRLAQMARAVGIHLVLATQRPSVEVITGLIKANITARVSFQVASQVDSRTILDMAGAEKLLGAGDMLFLSPELGKTRRIQSAFITQDEVRNIVNYIRDNMDVNKYMEDDLSKSLEEELEESETALGEVDATDDPLYEDAKKLVIQSQKGSASMLQRRLRIGYVRAARLIDTLETKGIVGPQKGSKAREVYVTNEDEIDNLEEENEE